MNDVQMVFSFASMFVGVLVRTMLPALKKLQTGQKWDHTYTATAFIAVITSFVTATLAFPTFNLPMGTEGLFGVFLVSFVFGWGLNDFYNKIFADFQTSNSTYAPTSTPQSIPSGETKQLVSPQG